MMIELLNLQRQQNAEQLQSCRKMNHQSDDCHIKNSQCSFCKKKGHNKKLAKGTTNALMIYFKSRSFIFQVDSGTSDNFCGRSNWSRIDKPTLLPSNFQYLGANGKLHVLGRFFYSVVKDPSALSKKIEFVVARKPLNLLGQSTLRQLDVKAKVIPDLSMLSEPLICLTIKGQQWNWRPREEASFQCLKVALSSDAILAHFDPNMMIGMSFDASEEHRNADALSRLPFKDDTYFDEEEKADVSMICKVRDLSSWLDAFKPNLLHKESSRDPTFQNAANETAHPISEHQNRPPKPTNHPWMLPKKPWSRLHMEHAIILPWNKLVSPNRCIF
ncbi:hypothetical protein J437_LFUL008091 [Ladona fulva]|uniref:Uncharacterized protein n=1 Tax=Ladona fulva TaxID=123851 RepID=A0A8K0KAH3_LADFU|nr:hypothetical protein J437_LFUL008091 [Ladona fulva]